MSETPKPTQYVMLSELLDDPELLVPPRAVIPRIAYQGRVTMLAAGEKVGKSTMMGQAAAAVSMGDHFFGEKLPQGAVIWVGLDEPTNDLVRRFNACGARNGIAVFREPPRLGEWIDIFAELRPTLVVIDTIGEYAAGFVEDIYRASDWIPVLKVFRAAAEVSGTAIVLLHHMVRNGARYADSRQLGAGVDVIVEMMEDSTDLTARKLKVRGRLGREDFTVRYEGQRYTLIGGELALEMRVFLAIQETPGISSRRLRDRVSGSSKAIDLCVRDLLKKGMVENRGTKSGAEYHVKPGGSRSVTQAVTVESHELSLYSQRESRESHAESHGGVPRPLKGDGGARSENPALDEPEGALL